MIGIRNIVRNSVVFVVCCISITTSFINQCSLQDGQCTYNINLASGSCIKPPPTTTKFHEMAPEALRQYDKNTDMHKMQQDLDIVKSDHENRIKELENSIQKVLTNAISGAPNGYSSRQVQFQNGSIELSGQRPHSEATRPKEGPSENLLMLQLQNQFNRMRSSLSTRTADLLETKNKLNETLDLLTEAQRQVFTSSSKLETFETKAAVLERSTNILKNKLKGKTERLDYATEKLNVTESKLVSIETQLYDVVRSENLLKEELETLKHRLQETENTLEELQRNHTGLTHRYQRTKKTLILREEELMECYSAKTQTFCGFEDTELCGWSQDIANDTFDWARIQGRTPSANTGPDGDHTCRNRDGHFMYIESSGRKKGDSAKMYSPKYRGLNPQCIQFYYHMSGRHVGTLTIHRKLLVSDEMTSIWRVFGNQGNLWIKASLAVDEETAMSGYQLIFEGTTDTGYEGDIGIDDFTIKDGQCDRVSRSMETTPSPLTETRRSKVLNEQIERYRKMLRRRMRTRNQQHANSVGN